MIILIGEYRLRVIDCMNYGVERVGIVDKGKLKGKEYIITSNFFPQLHQAVGFLFECVTREAFKDADTLTELAEMNKKHKDAILQQLILMGK